MLSRLPAMLILQDYKNGEESIWLASAAEQRHIKNCLMGMVYQNPVRGLRMQYSAASNIAEKLIAAEIDKRTDDGTGKRTFAGSRNSDLPNGRSTEEFLWRYAAACTDFKGIGNIIRRFSCWMKSPQVWTCRYKRKYWI